MAKLARRGKTYRRMRRIVRILIILLMARIAERTVQAVVVADVAIGALPWWHLVRSCERKARTVVIERSVRPLHRVMATFASRREIRRDVVHRR